MMTVVICVCNWRAKQASLVMLVEVEIYYIYMFIYLYLYVHQHLSYGFTVKQKRIDITMMPDECNFDSTTYELKIETGIFFRGLNAIIICW